jgi:hypothetical protein
MHHESDLIRQVIPSQTDSLRPNRAIRMHSADSRH